MKTIVEEILEIDVELCRFQFFDINGKSYFANRSGFVYIERFYGERNYFYEVIKASEILPKLVNKNSSFQTENKILLNPKYIVSAKIVSTEKYIVKVKKTTTLKKWFLFHSEIINYEIINEENDLQN